MWFQNNGLNLFLFFQQKKHVHCPAAKVTVWEFRADKA